ncbi:MAG: 1,4-dihydroxy-2-naphthoate polyprenyltransferase [Anaerolineae bacterium]|nr:1,4-dihydroxy-2-naphthoate polyprenyltransferase [Anaerolineae bacterium]
MARSKTVSPFKAWMLAARPKTLPAALSPVVVGIALAYRNGAFRWLPSTAALLIALLLQVGVNIANDYFDHVKGIDQPDRKGPTRVTQSGLIPPERVRLGMIIVFALAGLIGVYLVILGGWFALLIGLTAILSALAYSGGPWPLASHGLGDLFVFIYFGLAGVCGTYYVQALDLPLWVIVAAVPVGLLITAILAVNNLRDIETDRRAGKNTLAVIFGQRGTVIYFVVLLVIAYIVPVLMWLLGPFTLAMLLPLLTFPLPIMLIRIISRYADNGPAMNKALAGTAQLALFFSVALSAGILF